MILNMKKRRIIKYFLGFLVFFSSILATYCIFSYAYDFTPYASASTTTSTNNVVYFPFHNDKTSLFEKYILTGLNNLEKFSYFVDKTKKVAHAGGAIDGHIHNNSLEALNKSYQDGIRIFEIDFSYTSDGHLVLAHGFTENDYAKVWGLPYNEETAIMDYKTFKNTKMFKKYTTMDIEMLVEFMKTHEDVYIIPDIKYGGNAIIALKAYHDIINAISDVNILNRFLGAFYNTRAHEYVSKVYNFEIKAIFVKDQNKIEPVYEYCAKNNIQMMILNKNIYTKEVSEYFKNKDIFINVYTVNTENDINNYLKLGADMVTTDNK